jgi:hypothetical protein
MFSTNHNTQPALIYSVDGNLNLLHNLTRTENIDIEHDFTRNFSLNSLEPEQESMDEINALNSIDPISALIDPYPMPNAGELIPILVPINSNNQNVSFASLELENSPTKSGSNSILVEEENLIGRKRQRSRRPRKEDKDDIRVKIKRAFLNRYLRDRLNMELTNMGSKKYFEKFPKHFASDPNKKRNKEVVNMKLGEIFEKEELYVFENEKGKFNFKQNLKIVHSEEIKKNENFQKLLNKTFGELYEEHLNSDEFKVKEINRLKEKKMGDNYIKRYIELA